MGRDGGRVARLLLVEDNPAHLTVARDGDEALAVLRGPGPRPDLVLLDLQLPRRHGLEVLAAVRADPAGRDLAVAVFTSSDADEDRHRALALGADAFLPKPPDLDRYLEAAL
ncbi:MAG: response regulator [Deferrisomatales bacterium]